MILEQIKRCPVRTYSFIQELCIRFYIKNDILLEQTFASISKFSDNREISEVLQDYEFDSSLLDIIHNKLCDNGPRMIICGRFKYRPYPDYRSSFRICVNKESVRSICIIGYPKSDQMIRYHSETHTFISPKQISGICALILHKVK